MLKNNFHGLRVASIFTAANWWTFVVRVVSACSVAIATLGGPASAWAQRATVMVKTTLGCSVAVDPNSLKVMSETPNSSSTWAWSGDCIDGLGTGRGVLRHVWKTGAGDYAYETVTVQTGQMHRGQFYGFVKHQFQTNSSNAELRKTYQPGYAFILFDRMVGISGLGLIASDAVLDPAGDALPVRGFEWGRELMSIGDSQIGNLMLMKVHCGLDKQRFPECGFGEGEQKYEVYRFTQMSPAIGSTGAPPPSSYTYCPNPRDRNSCSGLAVQLSQPFVDSIEAFLLDSLPKLKDIDGQTRKAGAELAKKRADEAAAKALAAERAAQADARVRADFDAKLDQATVGELFAMADEYKSKGGKDNLLKARAVLRKLVARFPEHKLALLSAQMLTDLQAAP